MKRFFAILISIIFILSSLPSMAAEKYVNIDSVVANTQNGAVTIKGSLVGYEYSYWAKKQYVAIKVLERGVTPDEAEADNGKIYHVAECEVAENGSFEYTYTHKAKKFSDKCDIWVSAEGYTAASRTYAFYVTGVQDELLGNSGAVIVGSPLYYSNGLSVEGEKVPYEENGQIYIPSSSAAHIIGGEYNEEEKTLSFNGVILNGEYVATSSLKENGIVLYEYKEYGICYFGNEITENEAESLVAAFGIHVSKDGNDANEGTAVEPVLTINRALELYHTSAKNSYIFVHEGTYKEIIKIDSRYENLTLKGIGKVKIQTPSVTFSASEFSKVTNEALLKEFTDEAKENVLCAEVPGFNEAMPSAGGSVLEKNKSMYQIFQGEREAVNARYPNGGGFTKGKGEYDDGDYSHESLYYMDVDKLEKWGRSDTARALVFRACGYNLTYKKIIGTDLENKIIRFNNSTGVDNYQEIGNRFYVYDTLCEVDSPGEWYIDRDNEIIYYWPYEDFKEIEIIQDASADLVTVDGANNIRIENFEISRSRLNGVTLKNGDNIQLINCEVKNVGRYGIRTTQLTNSVVDGCEVHNVNHGGIYFNYTTEFDRNLVQQNNILRNCSVYNIGLKNPVAGGIYIGGTGNTASHNVVYDVPHMGIWFYGNDNIIEYNEFYNCLKYCDDAGVIYGNPGNLGYGNIVRYNYIHHFKTLNTSAGELYLIYLDSNTPGTLVEGNVIDISTDTSKLVSWGYAGGGRNTTLKGNLLIGYPAGDKAASCFYMSSRYDAKSTWLHQGLVGELDLYKFVNKLTDAQRELWFTKYPALENEFGLYVDYVEALDLYKEKLEEYNKELEANPNTTMKAPTKPKGSSIGRAYECYVIDNIAVGGYYYNKDTNTYEQNVKKTFGNEDDGRGERYDMDLSTGNEFYLEYDGSGHPGYEAGNPKKQAFSLKKLDITYPMKNSVVDGNNLRLIWDKDVSAGGYTVNVYNKADNTLVYTEETIENYSQLSIPTGDYRFELIAKQHTEETVLTETIEFSCVTEAEVPDSGETPGTGGGSGGTTEPENPTDPDPDPDKPTDPEPEEPVEPDVPVVPEEPEEPEEPEKVVTEIDLSKNLTFFSEAKGDSKIGNIEVYATYEDGVREKLIKGFTCTSSNRAVVEVSKNGSFEVVGYGMAKITVKCQNIEKSMIFYSTKEEPYRRNTVPPSSTATPTDGTLVETEDPYYPGESAMMIYNRSYQQITQIANTPANVNIGDYAIGAWIYDKGIKANAPFFGPGSSGEAIYLRYGASSDAKASYGAWSKNLTEVSSEENKRIPRTEGWHQIFAKVSYDATEKVTTTLFYCDGELAATVKTQGKNTPKFLHTGKNQEFKERYIARLNADSTLERSFEYTTENNKKKLSVMFKSKSETKTEQFNLIFASRKNGVLEKTSVRPITLSPLSEITEEFEADKESSIEAFMWRGLKNMLPMMGKITEVAN